MDTTITLKAEPGLTYSHLRLAIQPGSTLRIRLINVDEMPHNLLIVNPGQRLNVVRRAEAMEVDEGEQQFVPDSPDVLPATPLLQPG